MSENEKVITRFAPSPTGNPHLGSLRNALYAWLVARKTGGKFLLRIEDTDRKRLKQESSEQILKMLEWVGIDWDDELVYQSDRKEIYKKYADTLLQDKKAYFCFCQEDRLEEMRKKQAEEGKQIGYDGKCLTLSEDEIKQNIDKGIPYAIRFKMPDEDIVFEDVVKGEVRFKSGTQEDFVILKADGFPTYHFASVVDDYLQGINCVIRSDEWLSSVPKHISLYKALGWNQPKFAHLPLILAPDKSKLSKRHGSVSVFDFKNQGFLPQALINFVLLLGWHPKKGDEQEIFTIEEMIDKFSLTDVQLSPAIFDKDKLEWINSVYIKNSSLDYLADLTLPFFEEKNIDLSEFDLKKIIYLVQDRVRKLSDIPDEVEFLFNLPDYDGDMLIWKKSDKENTQKNIDFLLQWIEEIDENSWNRQYLEDFIKSKISDNGLGVGDVLWPMRVALTGMKNSPGPFECADALGKEKTIYRLELARKKLV